MVEDENFNAIRLIFSSFFSVTFNRKAAMKLELESSSDLFSGFLYLELLLERGSVKLLKQPT